MASLTMYTNGATWVYGPGPIPVGASGILTPLSTAGDGVFDEFRGDPVSGLNGVRLSFFYDGSIPPGLILDDLVVNFQWAVEDGNQSFFNTALKLQFNTTLNLSAGDNALPGYFSPVPSVYVPAGTLPDSSYWLDGTRTVEQGSLGYFTEQQLRDGVAVICYTASAPSLRFFVDQMTLTANFPLTLPTAAAPTAFDVRRNRFSMNSTLTGAGLTNATYPWTVWFEYTSADPTASAYDADAVNARFWTTDKQSVYNPDPTSTETLVTGVTASDLLPNMTYSVRVVVENQDGEQVKSDWTSVTTLKFDLARSR